MLLCCCCFCCCASRKVLLPAALEACDCDVIFATVKRPFDSIASRLLLLLLRPPHKETGKKMSTRYCQWHVLEQKSLPLIYIFHFCVSTPLKAFYLLPPIHPSRSISFFNANSHPSLFFTQFLIALLLFDFQADFQLSQPFFSKLSYLIFTFLNYFFYSISSQMFQCSQLFCLFCPNASI